MVAGVTDSTADLILVRRLSQFLRRLQADRHRLGNVAWVGDVKAVDPMPKRSDAVCGCCDTGWRTRGADARRRWRGGRDIPRRCRLLFLLFHRCFSVTPTRRAPEKLCLQQLETDQLKTGFQFPASLRHFRKSEKSAFFASLCSASPPYSLRRTTIRSNNSSSVHASNAPPSRNRYSAQRNFGYTKRLL